MYVIIPKAHVEGFLDTEALKLTYKLKETKNHQDWSMWIFSGNAMKSLNPTAF